MIAFLRMAAFVAAFLTASGLGAQPQQSSALAPLVIVTSSGEHRFEVEMADTSERRSRGLMFRRSMPANQGMLFDFKTDQNITMWMQNTYIPLDMIFIRADGTVARIARDTTPFSTDQIAAGEDVRAVLELNAGAARRIALAAGDRVQHPMFPAAR